MRYYDPEVGTYITRDPIGYGDGLNVYRHVHANPINHIDPLGLAGTAKEEEDEKDEIDPLVLYTREIYQLKLDTDPEFAEQQKNIEVERERKQQQREYNGLQIGPLDSNASSGVEYTDEIYWAQRRMQLGTATSKDKDDVEAYERNVDNMLFHAQRDAYQAREFGDGVLVRQSRIVISR